MARRRMTGAISSAITWCCYSFYNRTCQPPALCSVTEDIVPLNRDVYCYSQFVWNATYIYWVSRASLKQCCILLSCSSMVANANRPKANHAAVSLVCVALDTHPCSSSTSCIFLASTSAVEYSMHAHHSMLYARRWEGSRFA